MTADDDGLDSSVTENVEARSRFPVEIPEWVPTIIKDCAQESYGKWPEFNSALVRLTTDVRMRAVWAYLKRRRRADGRLLQPTRMTDRLTSDPEKRQELALLMLFLKTVELALLQPQALSRREVEENKTENIALAGKLWTKARTLAYLEEIGESAPGRAKYLDTAACVLWELSRADPPGRILVERDRHNLQARTVATGVAQWCFGSFGTPLYVVTATLTAVALDYRVTGRQVRQWWTELPPERG